MSDTIDFNLKPITELPPLEYLRSFIVFAGSENIVIAAEKLKISQPLLSKHLKSFEEALGAPLFEFAGRKKILNVLGQKIFVMLQAQLGQINSELHQIMLTQTQKKDLRIGARKEILDTLIPNLSYTGSLSFIPLDSDQIDKQLSQKMIDIGITQKEITSDRLVRKKLWQDELVLAWNSSLKLNSKDLKGLIKELQAYRCYKYGRSQLYEFLPAAKLSTNLYDWRILSEALMNEKSWGLLPIGYTRNKNKINFLKLPEEYSQKSQFYIYYQKEFSRIEWFQQVIQNLVQQVQLSDKQ